MPPSNQNLNNQVDSWALVTLGIFLDAISSKGLVDSGKLFKSLNYKLRYSGEEVDRISFTGKRYGFIYPYTGKGYTVNYSAAQRFKKGKSDSLGRPIYGYKGKKIEGGDNSTDWLFQALKQRLPNLADVVADIHANRAINASAILKIADRLTI